LQILFGYSYVAHNISDNDNLPVGGTLFVSKEFSVQCDFERLNGLFEMIDDYSHRLDGKLLDVHEWLKTAGTDIDPGLFKELFTFNKVVYEQFKPDPTHNSIRESEYRKSPNIRVSDAFKKGFAACAEIAAMAQYYLQRKGVDSRYFSGALLRSDLQEFAEPHSFTVIKHNGKTYIFDPANPLNSTTDNTILPNIFQTSPEFDAEVNKGIKRFVTCTNILSKKILFYGVDDHLNVSKENIV